MEVAVISYNMSVFSAMGYYGDEVKMLKGKRVKNSETVVENSGKIDTGFYPSEARFLRRASMPKEFFNNALNHLTNNVQQLNPVMIGIQEFHPPTLDEIMNKLTPINASYMAVPFGKEIANKAKILTIYDSKILGTVSSEYHEDLGETPDIGFQLTGGDKGRPISILFTERGYTLINFHGINRPRLTTKVDVADFLKPALQYHLEQTPFFKEINIDKVIITCDSNDRAHKINMSSQLLLNGVPFHDGHEEGAGAKSCCYNYDSCNTDVVPTNSKNPQSMGAEGAESKYHYTGDYVLARDFAIPVTAVESEHKDEYGASLDSDHMLVYAVIKLPAEGGKRKNRKSKRNSKNKRKSRRVRRGVA